MLGRIILPSALALVSLASLSAPSFADERFPLFSCYLGDEPSTDRVQLVAIQHDDGSWSDMQTIIEQNGKVTSVPSNPVDPKGNFFFANSEGPEGYFVRIRFAFDTIDYRLELLDVPPIPEADDAGGRDGRLTITQANGQTSHLDCGETDEYIAYMQQAMSCDMTNPYGAAGCDFDVRPTRIADDKLPEGFGRAAW